MALRVYDTLSQRKQLFEPLVPGKVGMYVCGVTVYDRCHIGHARVYVAFDTIARYLGRMGYEVTYVRNFTDVDDKIIKRALEEGVDSRELADRYIASFHDDMAALKVAPVQREPRVTDHIDDIIGVIERIIDSGHGYVVDGEVFFDVESLEGYGQLSKRKLDEMQAGASDRVSVDERKRNPADFVLWKASKPGEPHWDSPWGQGRPGWHIECSAMAGRHLGGTFDIHGGGKDLIFPHHENEIAQSTAAHGQPPARYWLHNGFVNVKKSEEDSDQGEKMSKSLGNFFTIGDVLEHYHPEAVRLFLLTTHYRSPIVYSTENLEDATRRVEYVYETLAKMDLVLDAGPSQAAIDEVLRPDLFEETLRGFNEAMDDDFNTARAIGELSDLISFLNQLADAKDKASKKRRHATFARAREVLDELAAVLGIFDSPPREVLQGIRARKLKKISISAEEVERQIAARDEARKARDFATADAIRAKLAAEGVVLMDSAGETLWKIA